MMNETPSVEFVIGLARDAGVIIREKFYLDKKIDYKLSSADLVTATDVQVEQMLIAKIKEKYPSHSFLCEESTEKRQVLMDGPTWVIDPVDGTMNFVHTLPFVAVSIAFTLKAKTTIGVIYNPIMDELFYATIGGGSWLLRKDSSAPERLHVSNKRPMKEAVVATGFSSGFIRRAYDENLRSSVGPEEKGMLLELKDVVLKNFENLVLNCRDLRRLGSCATEMAFIAAGRLDAVCEMSVKEWDVAAGVLIVEEAGGVVVNYNNQHPADMGARNILSASSRDLANEITAKITTPNFNLRLLE